jgi:Chaperonin 10 Kd subunit.
MKFNVIGRRLLVELPKLPTETESGIILPDSKITISNREKKETNWDLLCCTVIEVGDGITSNIKAGDKVLCHNLEVDVLYLDHKEVCFIMLDNVIAVVNF